MTQKEKADALRRLHHGPKILVLPNAWDVASARIIEELGFPVVATTSSGISNSLGYADNEHISRQEMLEVVARITAAVKVPVTADMEAGYASTAEEMAVTVEEVIEAGAVGLNLEDSIRNETQLVDVSLQVEKIKAVRETAARAGVPLVINARTDAYWLKGVEVADRMAETIRRANAYRQAGGDCIFVPGLRDPAAIAEFLKNSPGPMNVLAGPGAPAIGELEKLRVARVSLGGGPARTAAGIVRKLGQELLARGTYTTIAENAIPSPEMNALMRK